MKTKNLHYPPLLSREAVASVNRQSVQVREKVNKLLQESLPFGFATMIFPGDLLTLVIVVSSLSEIVVVYLEVVRGLASQY